MMRLIDADHLVRLVNDATMLGDGFKQAFTAIVNGEPTIDPERKWETCFDCPLAHGCPKIRGCSNEQAEKYASDIPDDCPLSIEPERKKGEWVWNENGMDWNLGAWCCSECGSKAETWWANDEKYNPLRCSGGHYCGNCGARMTDTEG